MMSRRDIFMYALLGVYYSLQFAMAVGLVWAVVWLRLRP